MQTIVKTFFSLLVVMLVSWCVTSPAIARDSALELSAQALAECQKGRVAKAREARLAHFERSQTLAEQAVALDAGLAQGHFALFCALGEKMRVDGELLTSLFKFNRMMAELDRTLALDPNHLEALSCKGTFLIKLPRLLGGDPERGERMLQQVVRKDPRTAVNARLVLAQAYAERGEHDEAIALASQALVIARTLGRQDLIPHAEKTLVKLQSDSEKSSEERLQLFARP